MTTARKRGSLTTLLPEQVDTPPMPAAPPPPADRSAPAAAAAAANARRSARAGTPDVRASEVRSTDLPTSEVRTPGLPKYKRLERKDVLLWPDQLGELSVTRRMLNRRRGSAGERITENTLIRVAVALLLSRSGELAGTTEEELRASLGLP